MKGGHWMNERYKQWLQEPSLDASMKAELQSMNEKEIEEAFYKDLTFGTGGMRGIVGAGTNRLNKYTFRKAVYGYVYYLLDTYEDARERGVAIAYDNRDQSDVFAREAVGVLAAFGIQSYMFDTMRTTPMLSFAVRHKHAVGGMMITASHNPPEYNGVKMYDEHGCQLVPHLAEQVIKRVNAIEDVFALNPMTYEEALEKDLLTLLGEDTVEAYLEAVSTLAGDSEDKDLNVVFTPLHGASADIGKKILKRHGFNVHTVKAQMTPDPKFSTVASPNPENPEAFAMAEELGKEVGADLLIASDPDGDRLALMCKHDGDYVFLTGNQTGAMFIDYMLKKHKAQGTLPQKGVVFNTIVTSEFGATIAKAHGMDVVSTLTGFKFIGEQMEELEERGETFVMGYEESYGYVLKDMVRDKDATQAILLAAEMADALKKEGRSLVDYLNDLYEQYGAYRDNLLNIVLQGKEGEEAIEAIMDHFRNNTPSRLIGRRLIVHEDYLTGCRFEEGEEQILDYPQSNVLKFIYEDDCWFVLRPSGTEPKLKVYLNVKSDTLDSADQALAEMEAEIMKTVDAVKNEKKGA